MNIRQKNTRCGDGRWIGYVVLMIVMVVSFQADRAAAQCSGQPANTPCVQQAWVSSCDSDDVGSQGFGTAVAPPSTTSGCDDNGAAATIDYPHVFEGNPASGGLPAGADADFRGILIGVAINNPIPPDPDNSNMCSGTVPRAADDGSGGLRVYYGTAQLVLKEDKVARDNCHRAMMFGLNPRDDGGTVTELVPVGTQTVSVTIDSTDPGVDWLVGVVTMTGVLETVTPGSGFTGTASDPTGNQIGLFLSGIPSTSFSFDTVAVAGNVSSFQEDTGAGEHWARTVGGGTAGNLQSGGSTKNGNGNAFIQWSWTESEDSVGVIAAPFPRELTAVSLDRIAAEAVADAGVRLSWETGGEARNLGFHVYRENEAGERVRITPEAIAGTALMTRDTLRSGTSYAWIDRAGTAGSRYWVEDLDLNGSRTMHGPVSAVPAVRSDRPSLEVAPFVGKVGEDAASAPLMRKVVRGLDEAETKGAQDVQRMLAASPTAVKIGIDREGAYRISRDTLVANGLPATLDPRELKMFVDGREVAIRVRGSWHANPGSSASSDAAIEFYATGIDRAETDTRVYWLDVSPGYGQRIKSADAIGRPGTGAVVMPQTVEYKERVIYAAAVVNGDESNFFGQTIWTASPATMQLPIPQANLDAGPVGIEVALQGMGDGQHDVVVEVADTFLGRMTFADRDREVASFEVPAHLVAGEEIPLRLSTTVADDLTLVDVVLVTYPRRTAAVDDAVRLSVPAGTGSFQLEGFSSGTVEVLDVSDPRNVRTVRSRVRGRAVLGGDDSRIFSAAIASPTDKAWELLAVSANGLAQPAWVAGNTPSDWASDRHSADALMVVHPTLAGALAPLADLRRSQGFDVAVVDVDDVYDEFSYGVKSPAAIRDLVLASTSWTNAPSYLLLVGDASYDPRGFLGFGDTDLVPTKFIGSHEFESSSDGWFGDADGAGLYVGRLPAQSASELTRMVDKIVAHEQNGPSWDDALLVADEGSGGTFDITLDRISDLLPADLSMELVRRNDVGTSAARAAVLQALSDGVDIATYAGHGGIDDWAGGVLESGDAASLADSGNPAIFSLMTCLNGYFISPARDSLGEALLKTPNGGALAVWATTGTTGHAIQEGVMLTFLDTIFGDAAPRTLGEAAAVAQQSAAGDIRSWALLGDPMLSLR